MTVARIKGTVVLEKNLASKTRFTVDQGSTRSSKTFSKIHKYLIKLSQVEDKTLTITRKTMPSLRTSVMRDFFYILKDLDMYSQSNHNKSENTYNYHGNLIEFVSMDQPHKKKGSKRNYLWMNEANEFTLEDYRQLNMRTTETVDMDYNPSDEYHWIYDKVLPRKNCTFIHSTYKDNPFLEQSLIDEIELYKIEDPNYWTIYGLGLIGFSLEKIYSKWSTINELPLKYDEIFYGMDFGFTAPSVLSEHRLYDNEIFSRQLIYQTRMTNTEFIEEAKRLIPSSFWKKKVTMLIQQSLQGLGSGVEQVLTYFRQVSTVVTTQLNLLRDLKNIYTLRAVTI